MSRADFTIKRGDTAPSITAQLLDGDEPEPLDDATVAFRMVNQSTDAEVTGLCSIENIEEGRVSYIWSEGDTDTVGWYDGEFIVDYDTPESLAEFDTDETFPSNGYVEIEVTESLE